MTLLYAVAALTSSCSALPSFPALNTLVKQGGTTGATSLVKKGVLPDPLKEGVKQWADSKAESAWNDAVAGWKKDPPENTAFPTWLAAYFDAPAGFACEKLGTGECEVWHLSGLSLR